MKRPVSVALLATPLLLLATCAEWGGLLSAAWPGDLGRYLQIANATFRGLIPYHGFYDEYPPGALPPFLLPRAVSRVHYYLTFKLLMIACWMLAIWGVARALEALHASSTRWWLAIGTMVLTPPLLGQVFINRYDPYASAISLLSLLALILRRETAGGALLGLGFEAKVFPAAAIPVSAVRVWRRRKARGLVRAASAFAIVCIAFSGFFLVVAFGGLGFSYYSQIRRGLQIESVGASILLVARKIGLYNAHAGPAPPGQIDLLGELPRLVGGVSLAVTVVAILVVTIFYYRGSESDERFVTAFVSSIVAYTVFSKVLSPQYITWLVPLVVLVDGMAGRIATLLLLLVLPLTQAENYWGNHGLPSANWSVWLLVARNIVLILLFGVLLQNLRTSRGRELTPSPSPSPGSPPGRGPRTRSAIPGSA